MDRLTDTAITYHHVHGPLWFDWCQTGDRGYMFVEHVGVFLDIRQCFIIEALGRLHQDVR